MAKDEAIPTEAVELLTQLMTANHEGVTHIYKEMVIAYKAEADALRAGVNAALATSVWGGTTAEYERVISLVGAALYPSPETMEAYRTEARAFVESA